MEVVTRKTLQASGDKTFFAQRTTAAIIGITLKWQGSLQPLFSERIGTGTPLAQGAGSSKSKMSFSRQQWRVLVLRCTVREMPVVYKLDFNSRLNQLLVIAPRIPCVGKSDMF